MQWGTLAVAALGAVFGIATTLITDVVRSRRELDHRWSETKRIVYARFLVALAQAHGRMAAVAFRDQSVTVRQNIVHQAYHAYFDDPHHSDAKSVSRELAIIAPDHIYQAAIAVYDQLRLIRDMLASEPVTADSAEYQQAVQPFFAGLEVLQQLMRRDLQPPAPRRA
ncbi:hypothetical protein GCM10022403_081040 [Streptomyces coacervatus]|uniref:Secreted protein n=1 Tax=Streptomyces coacervatus TaxID=647381 RepID=A0ABP7J7Z0_9ACTN|nr:hypothetical protein [Streptomyces coacervatus]MDF2273499.1 hypothetical protein [Streptomyces coacervatus]